MHAIEVGGLTKIFDKGTRAVDGVTFAVDEGELYGLLGPNGAGKTTTLKMLLTLLAPTSGSMKVFGIDARKSQSEVRGLIGSVPQEISADGDLTGYENLLIFAKLYYVTDRKERQQRIRQALEYMGLSERADDLVKNYSGGMMRRLEIAQALVNRPRILFLDEPSIGLDPSMRREVWKLIRGLNKDFKMTVLMTTHDMAEADELCDRLAIMNTGRIVATGTPTELKKVVGGDLITIKKSQIPSGSQQLAQQVVLPSDLGSIISSNQEEDVILPKIKGEEAIPKILGEYERVNVSVLSISLSRPTLDDVFLKYAKTRMGEAESMRSARLVRRSFTRHAG